MSSCDKIDFPAGGKLGYLTDFESGELVLMRWGQDTVLFILVRHPQVALLVPLSGDHAGTVVGEPEGQTPALSLGSKYCFEPILSDVQITLQADERPPLALLLTDETSENKWYLSVRHGGVEGLVGLDSFDTTGDKPAIIAAFAGWRLFLREPDHDERRLIITHPPVSK